MKTFRRWFMACSAAFWLRAATAGGADDPAAPANGGPPVAAETNRPPALADSPKNQEPDWNWHVQNTDILDYHPPFPAKYSGPNSLYSGSEVQETVSLDLLVGRRLWRGAEFHVDGLLWQGFGFSQTTGAEGFPNGEAFRLGTKAPNVNFTRAFIRQTIGLGGESEKVEDDDLHLAGRQDVSRLTFTLGKFSAKDIFDNNAYANDPRTQFMSWSLMANEAWDFPADSIGFTTGFAVELNQPQWTWRYGFFQMPHQSNGTAQDTHYLDAWGMVTEFEHRHTLNGHPGAIRLLAYLNHAHMGSYQAVVDNPALGGDITLTRAYRSKFGFGLNAEQELAANLGAFLRLGWSDGRNEAWAFSDVDQAASAGLSLKGAWWKRPHDTLALAGAVNAISSVHQRFFAVGGTGILAGDGALNYAYEELLETYYDFQVCEALHGTVDYQFITNPAFNRDRGPVSVFSLRLHWHF
jgi:high affinity Mn2+ porin